MLMNIIPPNHLALEPLVACVRLRRQVDHVFFQINSGVVQIADRDHRTILHAIDEGL